MFIKNIHVSLCSINLCLENGPGKKCIWKRICQIHQIRWIKYKYKYMVWNLIKYKYRYKYAVFVFVFVFANTNTYLTPALIHVYHLEILTIFVQASLYSLISHLDMWMTFQKIIFKPNLMIDTRGISCQNALRWMWMDPTNNKSTLVQVMAWCNQATSHYLNKPMLTQIYVTIWHHYATISGTNIRNTHWGWVLHIFVSAK